MSDVDDIRAPRPIDSPRVVSNELYEELWTVFESMMIVNQRTPPAVEAMRALAHRLRFALLRIGGVTE